MEPDLTPKPKEPELNPEPEPTSKEPPSWFDPELRVSLTITTAGGAGADLYGVCDWCGKPDSSLEITCTDDPITAPSEFCSWVCATEFCMDHALVGLGDDDDDLTKRGWEISIPPTPGTTQSDMTTNDETTKRIADLVESARLRLTCPTPGQAKSILDAAQVTQGSAARAIGVTEATVGRWLSGNRFPRHKNLIAWVDLLAQLEGLPPPPPMNTRQPVQTR